MKVFRIFILSLFALFILAIGLLESPFGKGIVQSGLVYALKRSGLEIEVDSLKGQFPQKIEIEGVRIKGLFGKDVSIERMDVELSILSFLRGVVEIKQLDADGVSIQPSEQTATETGLAHLSMGVSVKLLRAEHVRFDDLPEFEVQGEGAIKRRGRSAYVDVEMRRYDIREESLHLIATRNRFGKINASAEFDTPAVGDWSPVQGALHLQASAKGTLDNFTATVDGRFGSEWAFNGRIQKKKDQNIHIQRFLISTHGSTVRGSADLDEKMALARAQFQARADLYGNKVFANGNIVQNKCGYKTEVLWESPVLTVDHFTVRDASGRISGSIQGKSFVGEFEGTGQALEQTWMGKTTVTYRQSDPILFEQIELTSAVLVARGDLSLRPDKIWVGTVLVDRADLRLVDPYFFGLATGKCLFLEGNDSQEIQASAECRNVEWGRLKLDEISIETFAEQGSYPTRIVMNGLLKTPFELALNGSWRLADGTYSFHLDSLSGVAMQQQLLLLNPALVEYNGSKITLDHLNLSFGEGRLNCSLQRIRDQTDALLQLENIPLDFLSVNPLETEVEGSLSAEVQFKQRGKRSDGEMTLSLKQGSITPEGGERVSASATLQAALHDNRLEAHTKFGVPDRELFALDFEVPFEMNGFKATIPDSGSVSGKLNSKGQVEDLLDFFNLGMHRLEGDFVCDLVLSGNLESPHLEGSCRLIDGHYQNYLTGTELNAIAAIFRGQENKLVLTSMTAQDTQKKGQLDATGNILFSMKEKFPFRFDVNFSRLNVVQIDLMDTEAEGRISIDGNFRSAKVQGQVEIVESDLSIPDKIPRSYPELQVVYKNGLKPAQIQTNMRMPFPLELDLQVAAPEGIYIGGRGLSSEWKGDFSVQGTYAEPAVSGKLDLINGEFSFAGKFFKLTNGAISLKGEDYTMPMIDISGNTSEKGVSITARLRGPLNRPQITFQSVPPLPLSGILSYLLFGKDLSEVNGLQALQLAGTVASVAGEGPDVMEITRKSLGIDRLQIVMTPSSSGAGTETVALEVGKVLTPGLIITARQSADDSNPALGVEIDLTHGFTFEAESQQQPEQGKFSLKWNLNY